MHDTKSFYTGTSFKQKEYSNILRYSDWLITFPLLTIEVFYLLNKQDYFLEDKWVITINVVLGFFMILTGLLGDFCKTYKITLTIIGFIFLIGILVLLFDVSNSEESPEKREENNGLLIFISVTWLIYGFPHLL
jgi:bacteriorhodopsin